MNQPQLPSQQRRDRDTTAPITCNNEFSEGVSALPWQEDGRVVWVNCGAMLGSGREEHVTRYLRTVTIRSPGDVDEQSVQVGPNADAAGQRAYRTLPEEVRRAFDRLGK